MLLYRILLRLYPAWFRAEYGEEMCAVFASRRERENSLVLWVSAIVDVLLNAIRVHAEVLARDVAWTLRVLRQSPGFTITAILVIALGVGANAAAFALLDHVLLRPLPFPQSEQLVSLYQTNFPQGSARTAATPPNFQDWRAMNRTFVSMGAYIGILTPMNLAGPGEPIRLDAAVVSSDLFPTLGTQPVAGRSFTAEDNLPRTAMTAILSHSVATSLFGTAMNAVGKTIRLDTRPVVVSGVMPPGFAFPSRDTDLWLPLKSWDNRRNQMLGVVGRLRPDVSLARARADLEVISKQLERGYPGENKGIGIGMVRLRDDLSPQSRILVIAVFGAASCLLLIACTNLANLLFARFLGLQHEIAVRFAIGAARERLLRQLLTESLVLAIVGGAFGMLLTVAAIPALRVLVPGGLPMAATPDVNWRVFGFAAVLTGLTSVLFGTGPAWRSSREGDLSGLRSRSASGGGTARVRGVLVLAEVAGTVTLLVGAGLLLKAMWRVESVDPGFRADGVLSLRTALPIATPLERLHEFYSRVLTGARALPGVTSVGYVSFLPMTFIGGNFPVSVPGQTQARETRAHTRFVTPGYFATLQIPLLHGRDIDERDSANAPLVAVISRSLADRFWPGQNPIGRQIILGGASRSVVGVVGDVAVRGLETSSLPQIYFSSDQVPPGLAFYAPKDLVIRANASPMTLVPAVRRIIHEANPDQAISDVQLLDDLVAAQTATRRAQLRVLGGFAGIAFLLAAVGIRGLISFAASARTREVGVRIALGAARADILRMFLRQGLLLAAGGVAAGLPLAFLVGRAIKSLLFGVEPGDPAIYASAAVLALAMALAGSLRPAIRAAAVDPVISIRGQ